MLAYPNTLPALFASPWRHRELMLQLVIREIAGRYQGSYLGLLWPFLHPLVMLAVYTFFFSVVLKAQWSPAAGGTAEFALSVFAGLLVFNLFTEMIARAPGLVVGNANYVKKVVFPLEILPWASLFGLVFHFLVGAGLLVLANAVLAGPAGVAVLAAPLVLAPYGLFLLGLAWFLASVGTYIRDVGQVVTLVQTVMLFLSPVFFPAASLGPDLGFWLYMNPLTFVIESFRAMILHGLWPAWPGLALYWAFGLASAWLGFAWFQKTRAGFADVL